MAHRVDANALTLHVHISSSRRGVLKAGANHINRLSMYLTPVGRSDTGVGMGRAGFLLSAALAALQQLQNADIPAVMAVLHLVQDAVNPDVQGAEINDVAGEEACA